MSVVCSVGCWQLPVTECNDSAASSAAGYRSLQCETLVKILALISKHCQSHLELEEGAVLSHLILE
jgi:hypothetical protein